MSNKNPWWESESLSYLYKTKDEARISRIIRFVPCNNLAERRHLVHYRNFEDKLQPSDKVQAVQFPESVKSFSTIYDLDSAIRDIFIQIPFDQYVRKALGYDSIVDLAANELMSALRDKVSDDVPSETLPNLHPWTRATMFGIGMEQESLDFLLKAIRDFFGPEREDRNMDLFLLKLEILSSRFERIYAPHELVDFSKPFPTEFDLFDNITGTKDVTEEFIAWKLSVADVVEFGKMGVVDLGGTGEVGKHLDRLWNDTVTQGAEILRVGGARFIPFLLAVARILRNRRNFYSATAILFALLSAQRDYSEPIFKLVDDGGTYRNCLKEMLECDGPQLPFLFAIRRYLSRNQGNKAIRISAIGQIFSGVDQFLYCQWVQAKRLRSGNMKDEDAPLIKKKRSMVDFVRGLRDVLFERESLTS